MHVTLKKGFLNLYYTCANDRELTFHSFHHAYLVMKLPSELLFLAEGASISSWSKDDRLRNTTRTASAICRRKVLIRIAILLIMALKAVQCFIDRRRWAGLTCTGVMVNCIRGQHTTSTHTIQECSMIRIVC